jgi:2-oxoglutarate ferredoxin oxidoreductase subunit delta
MVATKEYKGLKFEGCGKGKATFYLYTELCKGCGLCLVRCPINKKGENGLKWSKEVGLYSTPAVEPDPEKCIACGTCEMVCPDSAIRIEKN